MKLEIVKFPWQPVGRIQPAQYNYLIILIIFDIFKPLLKIHMVACAKVYTPILL